MGRWPGMPTQNKPKPRHCVTPVCILRKKAGVRQRLDPGWLVMAARRHMLCAQHALAGALQLQQLPRPWVHPEICVVDGFLCSWSDIRQALEREGLSTDLRLWTSW